MNELQQKIADEIRAKIDSFCQSFDDGTRTHLGASIIGDKCKRKLWFTFRWMKHEIPSGRIMRIFDTGHKEEGRIIGWLKGAGYEMQTINSSTGKQFRIDGCMGHFGGSIDGLILIPDLGWVLFEAKSNKTGSEFKAFFDKGVRENKPKHWAQICTYGLKLDIKHCLYVCKNKDNDDLHIEIVELDKVVGEQMLDKAWEIIHAKTLPHRISESPAYFECKMCSFVGICHNDQEIDRNCRSCKFASPVENAEWNCEKYGIIPKEEIPKDKPCWEGII